MRNLKLYMAVAQIAILFSGVMFCENKLSNEKSNTFILFTMLYNESNQERRQEYIDCLERNLKHCAISQIHVLYDTTSDDDDCVLLDYIKQKPIRITYIKGRATFDDFFNVANADYVDCKIIISNADIYFNGTLHFLKNYNLINKFVALTRWNVQEDGFLTRFVYNIVVGRNGNRKDHPNYYSFDTWIFQSPIRKFEDASFRLGTWGCDGYIAYQAKRAGLELVNPCLTVQCCHLHVSEVRNYKVEKKNHRKIVPIKWTTLATSS